MVVAQARAESVGGGPGARAVASPAEHSRARIERLVVADQEVAVAQAQEDVVPALPRGEHAGGIVADDDVVAAPSGTRVVGRAERRPARGIAVADDVVGPLVAEEVIARRSRRRRGAACGVGVADEQVLARLALDVVAAVAERRAWPARVAG